MAVAAPELLALAALCASFFLIMLYYAYGYSLGALLQALAHAFRSLSINLWIVGRVGFGFVGDAIDAVDHAVRNALGAGIAYTQGGFHYFMHWSAYALEWMGRGLRIVAEDALQAITHLRTVTLPVHVRDVTRPISNVANIARAELRTLDHRAAVILAGALAPLHAAVRRAEALAGTIAIPRLGRLEREATALERRIGSLARRLSPSAIVALIGATIFTTLDLGWLRCRGVNRVGRHLCGLSGLIEELLAGAIEALVVVDLCQIMTLMAKGAREAAPALSELTRGVEGLVRCQRASRPHDLNAAWYAPPAATAALTL